MTLFDEIIETRTHCASSGIGPGQRRLEMEVTYRSNLFPKQANAEGRNFKISLFQQVETFIW